MKGFILGIVVVALVAGGYFLAKKSGWGNGSSGALNTNGRETTATVERGAINFNIAVAGEIGPAEQVSVRPEVNGRISELPVDVGDLVTARSLLFALDDRDLRLEVETRQKQIESAKLQLDKARIAMDQARRDYDRDSQLYDEKLVSEQAFEAGRERHESSMKDHDLARNSIERAEKDLALSEERLAKSRIMAPFDCTILTRPVSVGQAVSGSGGFNSGTEVLTIADLSSMVINAHVNQADVTRLKHGLDVEVEVDAVAGLKIQGEVERIAPQATVRNGIKGYATRIKLSSIDPRVQPGMTATISIPVSAADNVLTIPLAAVYSERGAHYVFARKGETFERRDIMVGMSDLFRAEIKSGLAEGEVVALEPPGGTAERIPGGGPAMSQTKPAGTRPATSPPAAAATTAPATAGTRPVGTTPVTTPGTGTSRPAGTRPGA